MKSIAGKKMAKLLLNTIALEPNRWTCEKVAYFKLDQLLEPIAKAGFRFVELWQFHISRETAAVVKNYRSMAEACGLGFPVIGVYPKLHLAGKAREREIDISKRIFDYARLLGSEVIKIWFGNIGSAKIIADDEQRSLDFLAEVLELAGHYNLTITGENHENTLLDTIASCKKILRQLSSPTLKICYQPYDFGSTEKAISDYKALHEHVVHIHFQGRKNGRFERLEHSDIDYSAFVAALAEEKFDGYWCIEFVKGCVAPNPGDFDMGLVLRNARRDGELLRNVAETFGLNELLC